MMIIDWNIFIPCLHLRIMYFSYRFTNTQMSWSFICIFHITIMCKIYRKKETPSEIHYLILECKSKWQTRNIQIYPEKIKYNVKKTQFYSSSYFFYLFLVFFLFIFIIIFYDSFFLFLTRSCYFFSWDLYNISFQIHTLNTTE